MGLVTLAALLGLLLLAAFVLKELVAVRRQVSSIRQFLEWAAVGFFEARKEDATPAWREQMEIVRQDLIREGVREGTLTEQQVNELFQSTDNMIEDRNEAGRDRGIPDQGSTGREYRVQTRRDDHWMSVWRGFSYDRAIRICRWGQKQDREMRIV